jgi:glycolate oxidase FAD binding subunit
MSTANLAPTSESEVAELVTSGTDRVHIAGGQSRLLATEKKIISTSALNGIVEYEPGALTMVAKAGTPLSAINAALQKENQQLAFEPPQFKHILMLSGSSTIGGVFATNASGSRRIQVGAARDHLLGVRFVDGLGRIIKNGGRVMKNVTGYDLVKLMAGSWGTLGLITEVSFKVLPIAETQLTLKINLCDARILTTAINTPYDISGTFYDVGLRAAYIRVEGFDKSVKYRAEQLLSEFSDFDIDILEMEKSKNFWKSVNNLDFLKKITGDLWRISVKPTDGVEIIEILDPKVGFLDWCGGLVWIRVDEGCDVRREIQKIAGHAMCLLGNFDQFHPSSTIEANLSHSIRKKFDPKMLFNQEILN